MLALIDADIICYEFGNMKDVETGELLAWPIVRKFVDERIEKILNETDATEYELFLTGDNNFRKAEATILPYKGHRPTEKPPFWADIRAHLVDNYDARVVNGYEADDAVGIEQIADINLSQSKQTLDTIICSRDKDLGMIAGWHYQWECGNQAMRKWYIDETDAIRLFYQQLLTGDSTDNILGLFGVGSKAKAVTDILNMRSEQDMFDRVFKEYENRFGSYAWQFLSENARLLWIWRKENDDIRERLRPLHRSYENGKAAKKEEASAT